MNCKVSSDAGLAKWQRIKEKLRGWLLLASAMTNDDKDGDNYQSIVINVKRKHNFGVYPNWGRTMFCVNSCLYLKY